jgi:hypothetical protein
LRGFKCNGDVTTATRWNTLPDCRPLAEKKFG